MIRIVAAVLLLSAGCAAPRAAGPALTHRVDFHGKSDGWVCRETDPQVFDCVDLETFLNYRAALGFVGKGQVEL